MVGGELPARGEWVPAHAIDGIEATTGAAGVRGVASGEAHRTLTDVSMRIGSGKNYTSDSQKIRRGNTAQLY